MAEVASAFVSLMPSAKGFGKSTQRQIGPQMNSVAKSTGARFGKVFAYSSMNPLKAIGAAAIGLFAIAKLKAFFGSAISEARESQKVSAITAQVIKSTGGAANISAGQVGKLATSISNMTGIDDEAIQAGANLLLTFKNVRNEAGAGNDIFNQTTRIMTDMSAAMGTDAKSSAIQLGKALNDPVKGITALTRVGVSFTDQQKKQIATLVASGHTLDAQKIILKELNSEFGGTAAAAATAGEKFHTAFANFQEAVGTLLLPYIDRAETAATRLLITMSSGAGPALAKFKHLIEPVVAVLSVFTAQINTLIHDHLQPFFTILSGLGGAALTSFSVLIGSTLVSALGLLVGALLSPVAILGAVAGAALYAYTHFEQFRLTVNGLATDFQNNVLPKIQQFGTFLVTVAIPNVIAFGQAVGARLLPVLQQLGEIITSQVLPAARQFGTFVSTQILPVVTATAARIGTNLVPILRQMATTFQTDVLPALREFLAAFRQNQPAIQKVTASLVVLVGGLLILATTVAAKVLPPVVRMEGLLLRGLSPAIVGTIVVTAKLVAIMATLATAMLAPGKAAQKLQGIVTAAFNTMLAVIAGLAPRFYAAGAKLVSMLGAGIRDKAGEAISALSGLASKLAGMVPGSPVKTGPLKSFNNGGAGKKLIQMLADGIIAGTPGAVSAATATATKIEAAVLDRLTAMRDGAKGVLDGLKSDFEGLSSAVASNLTGDLFGFDKTRDFLVNLVSTKSTLKKLSAAFKRLVGWGVDPKFLSALFSSGGSGLILELASGTGPGARLDALTAASVFGDIGSLSNQLGGQVATEQLGPELRSQTKELREIKQAIKSLPKHFGQEINKAVKHGQQKAS